MSFRVTEKAIRVRGKLLRVGQEVAVLHGPHVGRVGRYRGRFRNKIIISLASYRCGPCTRLFLTREEIAVVGSAANGK